MKFDEKRQFVQQERQGARKAGCKSCKKQTLWLILEGAPSLFDMLRSNASTADLNAAMRERGWYCRACIAKKAKVEEARCFSDMLQEARVAGEALRRQECERFLEEAPGGEYQEYLVSLPRGEYVDRMMGCLSNGLAANLEEAFLTVHATETEGD